MSGVSVALAAYRGERFIAEQISSLLAQTRPPDEIVITDDSPDELTRLTVEKFTKDGGIKYFRNPERLGVNGNFEKAIALCSGEYIFLCDQDDFWRPEKIEIMLRALEDDPAADAVFCNSTVTDAALRPLGYSLWDMRGFGRGMRRKLANGDSLSVFLKRVTLSAHNIALRRRAVPLILPYPPLEPFYSDTWIALMIAAAGRWTMADEELTFYRTHGENLSRPGRSPFGTSGNPPEEIRLRNAALAEEILRRIPGDPSEKVRSQLNEFRRHQLVRGGYPPGFCRRTVRIIRELLSGRYHRYSSGSKSAVRDWLGFR